MPIINLFGNTNFAGLMELDNIWEYSIWKTWQSIDPKLISLYSFVIGFFFPT